MCDLRLDHIIDVGIYKVAHGTCCKWVGPPKSPTYLSMPGTSLVLNLFLVILDSLKDRNPLPTG